MKRHVIFFGALWMLAACTGTSTPEPEATTKEPAADSTKAVFVPERDWTIQPSLIRYDSENMSIFVQVDLAVDNKTKPARDKPAFIGVTLGAADGEEFDLAIQTVFPSQVDQSIMFSAGVEKPIENVLIGLWDHKIEPCDSDRPGCKTYGFLLDGSLASWPPNLYVDFKRQRIVPGDIQFQWIGPERDGLLTKKAFTEALTKQASMFGVAVRAVDDGASTDGASENASTVVLSYKSKKDEVLAKQLAARLVTTPDAIAVTTAHDETLSVDFAVKTAP